MKAQFTLLWCGKMCSPLSIYKTESKILRILYINIIISFNDKKRKKKPHYLGMLLFTFKSNIYIYTFFKRILVSLRIAKFNKRCELFVRHTMISVCTVTIKSSWCQFPSFFVDRTVINGIHFERKFQILKNEVRTFKYICAFIVFDNTLMCVNSYFKLS